MVTSITGITTSGSSSITTTTTTTTTTNGLKIIRDPPARDGRLVGDSDSSDDSGDEPFAFDDYDVDEAAPVHRPAFGGRLGALVYDDLHAHTVLRRRGALLWSSHWFFFNRRLKRILFVTVWARSRGMTRWDDDVYGSAGKLQTISGERLLGWDGAVGAGAWAMGPSAAA